MPRPKTAERPYSFRAPAELMTDAHAASERLGISDSRYICNALIMALKIPWVIQADWYALRDIDPYALGKQCPTLSDREES